MRYKSLSDMFYDQLRTNKNKNIIIDSNKKTTYGNLEKIVGFVQHKLQNYVGFNNAKTIAFRFKNSVEYIAIYIAIIGLGKIAQPIYYEYSKDDMERILLQSKAEFLIDSKNDINDDSLEYKVISSELLFDDFKINKQKIYKSLFVKGNLNDPVLYLTSSGTTGKPKVIAHSNLSLLLNIEMHINSIGLKYGAIGLAVLPLPFGYSNMTQFLVHMYLGGTLVLGDNLIYPPIFIKAITDNDVTDVTVIPYFLSLVLLYMNKRGYDFKKNSSLKYILFGGGTLSKENFEELKKISNKNLKFIQTYGCTECAPRITTKIVESDYNKNNLGKPLNGIKINILKPDESGNGIISITTPCLMLGYVKRGKINKFNKINFIPGDIGKINNQGELIFKSRVKNMLKYRGFNLKVEEVEYDIKNILNKYLQNLDVRVGQNINGDLVAELSTDTLVEEKFIKLKLKDLPVYMRPTRINILDKIPRTANGKILRSKYL